jgi:hypothetical protein
MGFLDNSAGGGAFPPSIVPMPKQQAVVDNYINFHDANFSTWTQQYLPELYEAEVERYGNRTLSAFLRMVGAEMPMTSDQVIWSEQNRLHIAYEGVTRAGDVLTITGNQAVRLNQTIVIADGFTTVKALVVDVTGLAITAVPYEAASLTAAGLGTTGLKMFVYGSEFAKGTSQMVGSIEPTPKTYSNNPVIIKDKFEVSGSDAAQIGWIEVATEDGTSGYMWYLKAESETRLRFEDYLEMTCVEGVKAAAASGVATADYATSFADTQFTLNDAGTAGVAPIGTQGLFDAIETRGNVWQNFAGAAAPGAGALGDFDAILKQLDKQGAIEENMLFLNRATALDFDDMIAAMAGGGYAGTQAASYGLFDNESEMALNFGFSGFRRGSYDFYKTDWKYLNDATTRGLTSDIDGVMVPAGTTTVYDQMLGSNIRRPFLHVRYRASQTDDRRYKNWITGSVGGAYTSALDAMEVHFLSERCLVTQAANNFVLFKSTI